MEFDMSTLVPYILGGGGVVYLVIKHFLDKSIRKEEKSTTADQDLKNKNEILVNEKLELSIKNARLEERLLINAKNKVKPRSSDECTDRDCLRRQLKRVDKSTIRNRDRDIDEIY